MVMRWFLAFALSLQVTFALADDDYRKWTPEQQKQVTDRWNKAFESANKNIELAKRYASGKMDAVVKQIDNNHEVRTKLRESGIDPDTGKKIKIEANVTQKADKPSVAKAISSRLKNAKDYAKKVGKASVPTFVGMAAFHALMEGIDYVMGEGGEVIRLVPVDNSDNTLSKDFQYKCRTDSSIQDYVRTCGQIYMKNYSGGWLVSINSCTVATASNIYCSFRTSSNTNTNFQVADRVARVTPYPEPTKEVLTDKQIEEALLGALQSNNAELSKSIAEAIKNAYTPDNSQGQNLNDQSSNGLAVSASDIARDAVNKAGSNVGTEPTSNGKQGYYYISDGQKTVEGYVYPSDTTATGLSDSTTTTNPDGSTTTTGSMSQEWPAFCDWAGIVCEFIDWVREDEELQDPEEEEIDDSLFDRELEIELNAGGQCPPNPIWEFDFVGSHWVKEIDITLICDFFKYLNYALKFSASFLSLWIIYSAVVVRDSA